MNHGDRKRDPLPDESATNDELSDFWDTHGTTASVGAFTDADVTFDIRRRRYETVVQEPMFELLAQRAASLDRPVASIVEDALRQKLVGSA